MNDNLNITLKAAIRKGCGFVEIRNGTLVIARLPETELKLARCMAAAPEMLTALEDLVSEFDKKESVHIPWRTARAAIKKATTT
jgi:hypothetical protein